MLPVTATPRREAGARTSPLWLGAAAVWTAAVLVLALTPTMKSNWLMKSLGDKIIHGAAFTLGGLVWVKAAHRMRLRGAWAAISGTAIALAVGAAIELLQRYIPGRKADIHDFVADVIGVAVALLLLSLSLLPGLWRRAART
jgi:VanZ family protein